MSTTSITTDTTSEPPPPQILIPSLPNEIAISILARIPRSHYPLLSVVSKTFRSVLSSPLFYATRSLLNTSEHFLYLCFRTPTPTSLQWFTLYQNPAKNSLIPLRPTPSPLLGSAVVAVGPQIYVIGGSIGDIPSSHVWALDCRFHYWKAVPSMRISREFAAAGVVDGRIYVIGGCAVDTWAKSKNWAEVFDPKTEKWDSVDSGKDDLLREKWMHGSAVVNERIYVMADRNGVVYEPKTKKWESVESELDLGWRGRACVVDGILYCYDFVGNIRGFDLGNGVWKELRGVKELPRFLCGAAMANVGGKLVVIWEGKGSVKEMEVWCAEIEVGENEEGELWGRVEWFDVVHKVPVGSSIVHCLAVTL